jgi:histidinol dehydrogenase
MTVNGDRILTDVSPKDVSLEIKDPVDPSALEQARAILQELRPSAKIETAKLVEVAQRLGDIPKDSTTLVATKEECKAAFDALTDQERSALVNIHARVKVFAEAQRASVQDMEIDIPGGKAGHTVSPCKGVYTYVYK